MSSWTERLPLVSLTTFTLQDFPDRAACILWMTGCQMRCSYCHNPDFARGHGKRIEVSDTIEFLKRRRPMLDGVVFSGGECLLSPAIVPLIETVKEMGYDVKIDTNGGKPERLKELMRRELVDYVALDFKAPLYDYERITGWYSTELWEQSFEVLQAVEIDSELRTTVHPEVLDEYAVDGMMDWLEQKGFAKDYFIQNFQAGPRTLGDLPKPARRFDLARLELSRSFPVKFRNFASYETKAFSAA